MARFSAKAAAELGHHLAEEHQTPSVNCMHTQSLVGHAQVDHTLLDVTSRKKAVGFFSRHLERVRLRDECFVAMLALMDRMTVLGTRQATPVGTDEVVAEWLAAVLVVSKQSQCEAELNISPKDIIRRVTSRAEELWPSIVQAEFRIYRVLDYRVALPTALDITIRIAADISIAVKAAERQGPPVSWLGMVEGSLPAPSSELVASTPRFALLAYFLVELAFAHAPADIYGCGASPLALALTCLRLSLHSFGEPPPQCEGALEKATQGAEVNGSVAKLALRVQELWSHLPNSAVVRKWAAREQKLGGPLPRAPSPLIGGLPSLQICEASEVSLPMLARQACLPPPKESSPATPSARKRPKAAVEKEKSAQSKLPCRFTRLPPMGAQVFESKGQVKVTQKKRKFSEHASSIGSDEQNLDMPERLKSSQAPESNKLVPGVSWHNKYRC